MYKKSFKNIKKNGLKREREFMHLDKSGNVK